MYVYINPEVEPVDLEEIYLLIKDATTSLYQNLLNLSTFVYKSLPTFGLNTTTTAGAVNPDSEPDTSPV